MERLSNAKEKEGLMHDKKAEEKETTGQLQ